MSCCTPHSDVSHTATPAKHSPAPTLPVRPAADLWEMDQEFVLQVELPGVAPANVSLTLEKNVLTVSGSSTRTPPDGMSLLSGDQGNRTYERTFELSDQIERQQIDAEVKNGLLTIRLPKAQVARKQNLPVRQP